MFGNVLGALGGVWERSGAFWSVLKRFGKLDALRALWDRMGAFGRLGRLGRLGKHNLICMV